MSIPNRGTQKSAFGHFDKSWLENKLQKIQSQPRTKQSLDRICGLVKPLQRPTRYPDSKNKNLEIEKGHLECNKKGCSDSPSPCPSSRTVCGNVRGNTPCKTIIAQCVQVNRATANVADTDRANTSSHTGLKLVDKSSSWLERKTISYQNSRRPNNCDYVFPPRQLRTRRQQAGVLG